MTHITEYSKRRPHTRQKRQQHAQHRSLQKQREQLQREQARAQHALWALEQALGALDLPETVAAEVQWRLQAQQKLLGQIFGVMFPPRLWLPQLPGTGPGTRVGQKLAWPHLGSPAQAEGGQAVAAARPGPPEPPGAAGGRQKPCHA